MDLYDHAMMGAAIEGIADGVLLGQQAICLISGVPMIRQRRPE
jgi:hypothetical protein